MNESSVLWEVETNNPTLFRILNFLQLDNPLVIFTLYPVIVAINLGVVVSSKFLLCFRKRPAMSILEESRNVSLVLLGNLALTDIMSTILLAIDGLSKRLHNYNGGCTIKGLILASAFSMSLNVLFIAIDRYTFIVHSIKYDHYMNEQRARWLAYLSWIPGVFVGFLPLELNGIKKGDEGFQCRFLNETNAFIMVLYAISVVPVMAVTCALFMAVYRKAKTVSNFAKIGSKRLKKKSMIVVLLSSSSFCLTGGPFLVTFLIFRTLCVDNARNHEELCSTLNILLVSPLPLLGFLNTLINPIIFAWWHRPFTKSISNGFKDAFWPRRNNPSLKTVASIVTKNLSVPSAI